MFQRLFHAAKAPNQLHRPFVANPRSTRNVIHGVAAQRHHLHHFRRRHTQQLFNLRRIADQIVFRRIQHLHFVVHQLQHVFVARNDKHRMRFRRRFSRQRSNHIVGFVTLELQNRDAISLQRPPNVGNLLRQVRGHLGAVCLVAAIFRFLEGLRLDVELADGRDRFRLLTADGRRGHIEHRRQILGRKIVAQLAQHVDKNKRRRRRDARLGGHRPLPRHGMIGAKNKRHRIDQENPAFAVNTTGSGRRRSTPWRRFLFLSQPAKFNSYGILYHRGHRETRGTSWFTCRIDGGSARFPYVL